MSRLNLFLVLVLIASSLVLVKVSHESRRMFVVLERAQSDARALDTEFKRLDAERQAQATHLRVEHLARDRLGMRTATPAVTRYVDDTVAPAAVGAAAGAVPADPTAVSAARPDTGALR